MNPKTKLYKTLVTLLLVPLLVGCNLASKLVAPTATTAPTLAAATDTTAPTVDQGPSLTQAAQTKAANATLKAPSPTTAAATATATVPTSTITPTLTVTVTFTPLPPTAVPTATFNPIVLTPSNTPNGYACQVTSTKPTTSIKINTNFNFTWVIQNTGTAMWGQHSADLLYISGTKMQTGGDRYNLTKDIMPGDSYTATVPMKSPSSSDTYTASWEITQDGVLVCPLSVSVTVVK